MFNLQKFIADSVTYRPVSMFATDIEANKETLIACLLYTSPSPRDTR